MIWPIQEYERARVREQAHAHEAPRPKLTVACAPFHARLTERGCKANVDMAAWALEAIEAGMRVDSVGPVGLARVLMCGQCGRGMEVLDSRAVVRVTRQIWEEVSRGWARLEQSLVDMGDQDGEALGAQDRQRAKWREKKRRQRWQHQK